MTHRRRKRNTNNSFSGNHQRSWLWGHHAVTETLQAGMWPMLEIYVSEAAYQQFADLLLAKQHAGTPVEIVTGERLQQLARTTEHQGLVARLGPYPYCALQNFERQLKEQLAAYQARTSDSAHADRVPLVVICDRIQDAFNFGAILRCCDGANVAAVIVGEHSQAEVTPHVARSSAGAVNYLPIVKVPQLLEAVALLQAAGMQLIGADSNSKNSVWKTSLKWPTALVLGSEAHGISAEILARCDHQVCIPMQGHVTSLNAAVAAGILLYEIRRQQGE